MSPTKIHWRAEFGQRLRTLWVAKMLGTITWIAAFFVGYFWVLRNPITQVTMMPITAFDRWVDFRPEALALYASLWLYVSIAPALLKNFAELVSYGAATLVMSVVGLASFIVWPTAVPPFDVDWSQHPPGSLLEGIDASGNACPSMHVAFAVFTGIWMERLLRDMQVAPSVRALSWIWCAGIVYSTLATRQHVVVDVVAGAAVGGIIAALHLRALEGGIPKRAPAARE